jgi:ATP-dependent DNA helicase RecQ
VTTATTSAVNSSSRDAAIAAVLQKYWGYDALRPLQREAIEAGLAQRDSLVVLPTGGGKSLCYQIPPLLDERTDIVVSPLISLMKDQVDALRACGYPAAALYTGISDVERSQVMAGITQGRYRLVFVAPERLLTSSFMSLVSRLNIRAFAIDEAHCISQWGHDFRPEYRRLAVLKERFPGASIHAFTATATPKVRQDIIEQLKLAEPQVLVGNFDRPNLVYRIEQRDRIDRQVLDAIRRHDGEAVIVYCISRKETERMAAVLRENGVRAAAYHAGLDARERNRVQESFAAERIDVVVATVAFGMGIDRSNVRCVIHAAMPKSIEHYQQETGRAGRDGLEAECVLFHSGSDYRSWEWLITQSAAEAAQPEEVTAAQLGLLSEMNRFCLSSQCRHAALVRYFGQTYEKRGCGACDVCLTDRPAIEGGDEVARKVVSCVFGLGMAFGVGYVVEVLTGARTERIQNRRHDRLPEYGSLRELGRDTVQDVVYQLVNQGIFERTDGDRPVLKPARLARQVVQGALTVSLQAPMRVASKRAPEQERPLTEDVRVLFELLRSERRAVADEQGVAPFIVFGDGTLYELARTRPTRLDTFANVKGVGEQKLAQLGQRFIDVIAEFCRERHLATNLGLAPRPQSSQSNNSASRALAFKLFERGRSLDDVVSQTGRARSTVCSYLEDFVGETKPKSVDAWVDPAIYRRIEAAAKQTGGVFLRPVFEALNGEVSYDDIRIVMKHSGLR